MNTPFFLPNSIFILSCSLIIKHEVENGVYLSSQVKKYYSGEESNSKGDSFKIT